jgi:hypothetical protein
MTGISNPVFHEDTFRRLVREPRPTPEGAIAVGGALPVPGPAVRREYLKLSDELIALTRSFRIQLPPQIHHDAAVLSLTIECADRLLDAITEPDRRARFSADLISCWRGETFCDEDLTPELADWLARLKDVAERHGATGRFQTIIRRLLENSERMRTTRSPGRFISCATREGRLMVELLLLVLGDHSTPQFNSFMRQLAGAANLGDKLRDARRDFERGEIAVRPTLLFRARLAGELIGRTLGLARVWAGNGRLAAWGFRSLFTEFVWFRFSKSHSH